MGIERTRARRVVGTGALAAGTAAVFAGSAFGHIPGVGNGLAPTTNGPDLRSVTVSGNDPADGLAERVRYCFDESINTLGAAGSHFNVQTYDARRSMNPSAVNKATDNANCVIGTFASGTDVGQASVGEVTPGAVTNAQGRANDYASEPATGSSASYGAGTTTGPDLAGVDVDVTNAADKRVTYTFDETVNPATYSGANFGFYLANGQAVAAPETPAPVVSGNRVTVRFGSTASLTGAVTRFFANPGAVTDRPQTTAPQGVAVTTPSSRGIVATAASPRPEIASAAAIGPQQYRVAFSQPISLAGANPALFFAVSDDGSAAGTATAVGSGGDANSIILTFAPAVSKDPASIVKIVANPNAIVAASDGVTTNAATQGATATPAGTGFTNGPDLLSVAVDGATNRVTYRFDEAVSAAAPAAAFRATASDGSAIASTGGVVVSGNQATANFPATVSSAVAFSTPYSSLSDETGRPNPHQSVSNQIQSAPGQGAPAPAPAPTAAKGAKPRYRCKVTIHRKRTRIGKRHKRGWKYYGRVTSSRKACTQGRRVVLKRYIKRKGHKATSKRYGMAISSKKKGTFTIKRRKRVPGKVYVSVTGRSTSINCLPKSSRKIRG